MKERLESERQYIATFPKPRKVLLEWKNKLLLIFVPVALFVLFWWPYKTISTDSIQRDANSLLGGILLPILMSVALLWAVGAHATKEILNLQLVRNGECAVGTILSLRKFKAGRGTTRQFIYSFPVGCGKPMSGHGSDLTNSYSKGMQILVFYDPEDISCNVAYCSTYWRIRTNEGYLLEP